LVPLDRGFWKRCAESEATMAVCTRASFNGVGATTLSAASIDAIKSFPAWIASSFRGPPFLDRILAATVRNFYFIKKLTYD